MQHVMTYPLCADFFIPRPTFVEVEARSFLKLEKINEVQRRVVDTLGFRTHFDSLVILKVRDVYIEEEVTEIIDGEIISLKKLFLTRDENRRFAPVSLWVSDHQYEEMEELMSCEASDNLMTPTRELKEKEIFYLKSTIGIKNSFLDGVFYRHANSPA